MADTRPTWDDMREWAKAAKQTKKAPARARAKPTPHGPARALTAGAPHATEQTATGTQADLPIPKVAPLRPTTAPPPPPEEYQVHEAMPFGCQTCGAALPSQCEHPPFYTPEYARLLGHRQ